MNKTMLAAFVKSPYQYDCREVIVPEVKPGWALVKVDSCGICGTDMNIARSEASDWSGFGHEIAGVVAAIGAGVSNVKEGDTVTLESSSFCGTCDVCRNGRVELCRSAPNFWRSESMGFAEYILAPQQCLVPFDGLSFEVACLAEPLGVALDVTLTADIQLGDDVLVLGLGPIGLMTIPLIRMKGAGRVYAANRSGGRRLDVARVFGAHEVFSTGSGDDISLDASRFRKGGVERAVISAPPSTIAATFDVMRFGGIIAYIGIEHGERARISFDANVFHFKKLQLRASHATPALYYPNVLQLLKDKHVDGEAMISHVMPLERIAEAMTLMRNSRDEVLKIVIKA